MKRLALIIALTFVFHNVLSQEFPKIVPPSPEAASLAKFIEVPISHYTGLPNISVPFFNINFDGMEIPIAISYHARGIKVEEVSSRVGLGWALNAGGMITRQIRGKADDYPYGYLRDNRYETFFTDPTTRAEAYNLDASMLDLTPDLFMYNFSGGSGKFVFDQRTKAPLMQNFNDMKIENLSVHTSPISGFKITDKNGFQFFFNIAEKEYVLQTYLNSRNNGISTAENSIDYNNSWYLQKIISAKGREVTFSYEIEPVYFYRRLSDLDTDGDVISSYSKIKTYQNRIKEINFPEGRVVFTEEPNSREDLENGHALQKVELFNRLSQRIKSFVLDYSYVTSTNTSNLNGHLSYLSQPYHNKRLVLDSIRQLGENNELLPYYKFDYHNIDGLPSKNSNSQDNWGYYNAKYNGEYLNRHANRSIDTLKSEIGLLKKMTFSTGGSVIYEYEQNKAIPPKFLANLLIPPNNPTFQKSVGILKAPLFWNGTSYNKDFDIGGGKVGGVLFDVTITNPHKCSSTEAMPNCMYQIFLINNDTGNIGHLFIGQTTLSILPGSYTIKAVPTNPSIENPLDFENMFAVSARWDEQVVEDLEQIYAPGKRIKRIVYKDSNETIAKALSYTYNDEEGNCSGKFFSLPNFHYIQSYVNGIPIFTSYHGLSGNSVTQLQGNSSGYSHITEHVDDGNFSMGKTDYSFTVFPDSGKYYEFPYHLPTDNEWLRGQPLSIDHYRYKNGAFERIKSFKYEYSYGGSASPTFITNPMLPPHGDQHYINNRLQYNHSLITFVRPTDNTVPAYDSYKSYYINGGAVDLKNTIETTFIPEQNDSIVVISTSFFNYDRHYQTSSLSSRVSDDKTIIRNFTYPQDLASPTPTISDLVDSNRHVLLETKTYKDANNDGIADGNELINTDKTAYNWIDDVLEPVLVQSGKGNNSALIDRILFKKYDDKGNVLQISRPNGPDITYIYGYHKTLPIAKIENATYGDIPSLIYDAIVSASNADSNPATEDELRTELEKLRNSNFCPDLADAMVTTYTYDPLIGVTSMTDPKGYTVYYEYDGFNRLEHVKDAEGNILSKNEYNYKN